MSMIIYAIHQYILEENLKILTQFQWILIKDKLLSVYRLAVTARRLSN